MKGQTLIPSRPHADNSPPKIIDCCVTVYVHLGECYHPINIISPDTYRRAYKMLQHCMYCFIILSPTVDCCIIYLPPPFKDIPNIYSAPPRPVSPSVLCPCAPLQQYIYLGVSSCKGRSNSMWKRKRPFKSLRKIWKNVGGFGIASSQKWVKACARASSPQIRSYAMHLVAMWRWTAQGWLQLMVRRQQGTWGCFPSRMLADFGMDF